MKCKSTMASRSGSSTSSLLAGAPGPYSLFLYTSKPLGSCILAVPFERLTARRTRFPAAEDQRRRLNPALPRHLVRWLSCLDVLTTSESSLLTQSTQSHPLSLSRIKLLSSLRLALITTETCLSQTRVSVYRAVAPRVRRVHTKTVSSREKLKTQVKRKN